MATSSWQSIPSILNTDSAWTSQTGQAPETVALIARAPGGRTPRDRHGFLHVLQSLRKQPQNVGVVERIEHHAAGTA